MMTPGHGEIATCSWRVMEYRERVSTTLRDNWLWALMIKGYTHQIIANNTRNANTILKQ